MKNDPLNPWQPEQLDYCDFLNTDNHPQFVAKTIKKIANKRKLNMALRKTL
jgi:hypothetical protein